MAGTVARLAELAKERDEVAVIPVVAECGNGAGACGPDDRTHLSGWRILFDDDRKVARQLNPFYMPRVYVLNQRNELVYRETQIDSTWDEMLARVEDAVS